MVAMVYRGWEGKAPRAHKAVSRCDQGRGRRSRQSVVEAADSGRGNIMEDAFSLSADLAFLQGESCKKKKSKKKRQARDRPKRMSQRKGEATLGMGIEEMREEGMRCEAEKNSRCGRGGGEKKEVPKNASRIRGPK